MFDLKNYNINLENIQNNSAPSNKEVYTFYNNVEINLYN